MWTARNYPRLLSVSRKHGLQIQKINPSLFSSTRSNRYKGKSLRNPRSLDQFPPGVVRSALAHFEKQEMSRTEIIRAVNEDLGTSYRPQDLNAWMSTRPPPHQVREWMLPYAVQYLDIDINWEDLR